MRARVLISLVTWNGAKYMRCCFDSLLSQSFKDYYLILLDNGSGDETLAIAREYLPKFEGRMEILANTENLGFAKGHNQIIGDQEKLGRGYDYVLVLNQDIMLDEKYLERCLVTMDNDRQLGSVSGKLYRWELGESALTCGVRTDKIDSFGLKISKSFKISEARVGEVDAERNNSDFEVFGVSGTAPIYRSSALKKVIFEGEVFDPDFFSYKEDVDLAFRLRHAGYTSKIVGSALAWHDRGAKGVDHLSIKEQMTYRKSKRSMINYHSYKNHWFVLYKNIHSELLKRFFFSLFWYEFKKLVYLIIYEQATLKAFKDVFRLLPKMRQKRKHILSQTVLQASDLENFFY